ncbi:MAG: hypothetical protein SFU98_06665 [Leptospiraceae bacterium]|nr:hypothetical protein [Leptospiraceae bacterium]
MSFYAITSYFNPENYQVKRENFFYFHNSLKENSVPLVTVECSFDQNSTLGEIDNHILVQANSVMWFKEQLLNIGIKNLPKDCTHFAWLDCDLFFENSNWASEAVKLLKEKPIIQLFSKAFRLEKGTTTITEKAESWTSFAFEYNHDPHCFFKGNFDLHGHSGFAWAARREIFSENELYPACVIGSGDHAMAHAFVGDWSSPCINRVFGNNKIHILHFQDWARKLYPKVKAKIGFLDGSIYHLWHGDPINRKYVERNKMLANLQFNPYKDIIKNKTGLYDWILSRPELEKFCKEYFIGRKEDLNLC